MALGQKEHFQCGFMGLGNIEDVPAAAVNIGAAAADITVETDVFKTLFYVLEAASRVDKHQVPIFP